MKERATRRDLKRVSYRWHRRIGVLVSLPLLLIAITGIVLNHPSWYGLNRTFISNPLVLSWYGMTPQNPPISLSSDATWATVVDSVLYLNATRIDEDFPSLTGLVALESVIAISGKDSIWLVERTSLQLIEKLGAESIPPGKILALGVDSSSLLIDTDQGQFRANADLTSFAAEQRNPLTIAPRTPPPQKLLEQILTDWRGRGITLGKLVLDIHSGAAMGSTGTLLSDLVAAAIILLVLSGMFNSFR